MNVVFEYLSFNENKNLHHFFNKNQKSLNENFVTDDSHIIYIYIMHGETVGVTLNRSRVVCCLHLG